MFIVFKKGERSATKHVCRCDKVDSCSSCLSTKGTVQTAKQWKFLLPFCAIEGKELSKHKELYVQRSSYISIYLSYLNYNFACGSVWVRNLVSYIKGGTQTEGV
jgi:hypothetical protein